MQVPASYRGRRRRGGHLAGVPASTHYPHVVRDTMLDFPRNGYMPWRPILIRRQNVHLANHVAVRLKPARRTEIHSSLGFVPRSAVGTGLGSVRLALQHYPHPRRCGFVGHILADLAVAPLADLLVGLFGQSHAISAPAHVAYHRRCPQAEPPAVCHSRPRYARNIFRPSGRTPGALLG